MKTAYCSVCHSFLPNGKQDIDRHQKTEKHDKGMKLFEKSESGKQAMKEFLGQDMTRKVCEAELRLVTMIAEENLPFSLSDPLVAVMKKSFTQDPVLAKVQLGRQKCGNMIRGMHTVYLKKTPSSLLIVLCFTGFGSYLGNTLKSRVEGKHLGLIMDETTDLSVKSQLAVIIQYFNTEDNCQQQELLDIINCSEKSAESLTNAVIGLLTQYGIKKELVVGFCADTTNSMFGVNHSVSTLLRNEIPDILCVKCSCHSIHLCSHYASLNLPKSVEDVVRGVCTHFSRSPKRRESFEKFQKLVECEQHVFLRLGQTRWLTMQYAVDRVLEQYDALSDYFKTVCKEDPTVTHDVILTALEDPITRIYLEFLSYALKMFNDFNTNFQSEVPLLHCLKGEVETLIRNFANNYMESTYVDIIDPLDLDPLNLEMYLPLHEVYLGMTAKIIYRTINCYFYNSIIYFQESMLQNPLVYSRHKQGCPFQTFQPHLRRLISMKLLYPLL